jgi:hypothetical protein
MLQELSGPKIKKRILVLSFKSRLGWGSQALLQRAKADARNKIAAAPDTLAVDERDVELPENLKKFETESDREALFAWARSKGISGVLSGSIEDLGVSETGDDIGLFRARKYQTTAKVRVELYDTTLGNRVLDKLATASVEEERTEILNDRSPASAEEDWGKEAVAAAVDRSLGGVGSYLGRIAWVGKIAKVEPPRLYINGGEASGLTRGQLLRVFSEGVPVMDPKSGTSLGLAPGRFKGLIKVVDLFGADAAVAVVHSGAGFKEQDPVEVYTPPLN